MRHVGEFGYGCFSSLTLYIKFLVGTLTERYDSDLVIASNSSQQVV